MFAKRGILAIGVLIGLGLLLWWLSQRTKAKPECIGGETKESEPCNETSSADYGKTYTIANCASGKWAYLESPSSLNWCQKKLSCSDYQTQTECGMAGCYWWKDGTCHPIQEPPPTYPSTTTHISAGTPYTISDDYHHRIERILVEQDTTLTNYPDFDMQLYPINKIIHTSSIITFNNMLFANGVSPFSFTFQIWRFPDSLKYVVLIVPAWNFCYYPNCLKDFQYTQTEDRNIILSAISDTITSKCRWLIDVPQKSEIITKSLKRFTEMLDKTIEIYNEL